MQLGEEGSGHWSSEETSRPPRGRVVGPLGRLGRSPGQSRGGPGMQWAAGGLTCDARAPGEPTSEGSLRGVVAQQDGSQEARKAVRIQGEVTVVSSGR